MLIMWNVACWFKFSSLVQRHFDCCCYFFFLESLWFGFNLLVQLTLLTSRTPCQSRQESRAPSVVIRDGAVSGVMIKPVDVLPAFWTEIERTCKDFDNLLFLSEVSRKDF